ncbi:50S ribosome-binding GTPase [Candidatus Pacearchaeota archaeon]|nr:50S ribosome-binding GTPase [Candidatus Pacearchaeota archaeon]
MATNPGFEFANAEKKFYAAKDDEDKIEALKEMLKYVPKHKSAEALRANLRTRYKKLRQEMTKKAKKSSGKKGIKKEVMQAVLVGLTNAGKSSILKSLTNAQPKIASYGYTTIEPLIGTLHYQGCNIQLIDMPPIGSDYFDRGVVNNADTLLIVVEKINEIKYIFDSIKNPHAKRIVIFNKIDMHDEETRRKIRETLRTKKYNFAIISTYTEEGLDELKEKILNSFDVIRVYTKHQGKRENLDIPVVLQSNSTLKDVAEKILHGYSKKVKFAKIWGPSSKFPGQQVGLKHEVKDKDIVEFFTE